MMARMPPAPACRLLAALGASLVCAGSLAAQGAAPGSASTSASSPPSARWERPATVNGEAITPEDIAVHVRLLAEDYPDVPLASLSHAARRSIGEEILLAGEASRLGVHLTERDVSEYWERRRGSAPDYQAIAALTGTSVARQKDLAHRAALAELYLLHRVGLRNEHGNLLTPDPLLVRLVSVTPSQLRAAFEANRDSLGTPERVVCDLLRFDDPAAALGHEQALARGERPPGPPPVRRTLALVDLPRVFPAALAEFAREAAPGAGQAFSTGEGPFVLVVAERLPAREADYASSQQRLRTLLLDDLLAEARRHLVVTLSQKALVWPRELFHDAPAAVANPPSRP